MRSNRLLSCLAACVAFVAASTGGARVLPAQSGGPSVADENVIDSLADFSIHLDHRLSACQAAIPASSMHRVPVFLAATMAPHTDSAFTLQADLLAQDVAAEVRRALGARGQDTPLADGEIAWYSVPSQLVITAWPDGRTQSRTRGFADDSSAALLLSRAFDSVRAREPVVMVWLDGSSADSIVVRLTLMPGRDKWENEQLARELRYRGRGRVEFASFFLSLPDFLPALPKAGQAPPRYPRYNEQDRIEGQLTIQLVVDSTGRADPATIHDVWPKDIPRLTGGKKRYYDAFVYEVAKWEERLKYFPASIGQCPVSELVQQHIEFRARTRW